MRAAGRDRCSNPAEKTLHLEDWDDVAGVRGARWMKRKETPLRRFVGWARSGREKIHFLSKGRRLVGCSSTCG